ncbi:MAG: hypothetical protein Q7J84_06650 [Sulfuricaulis sp.]|nr:hypothetical protein [Sulfuricaulis sp.]
MNSLDRAIELVWQWKADRQARRADVLDRLETVVKDCQAAVQVWQGYLDKPGAPGDHWTIVSWIGPVRAKQLHDINLRAKQNIEELCRMAGPQAGRFIGLEENVDVIEMAYRMLKPNETGTDAAKSAVQTMQQRMDYLRGLMQRLRAAKPDRKNAPTKTTGKKAAAGKSSSKKTAKKAAKKKAPAKK